jgi:hypothetical protein
MLKYIAPPGHSKDADKNNANKNLAAKNKRTVAPTALNHSPPTGKSAAVIVANLA